MTSTLPAESVLPLAAADLACYAQLVYPGFELPWHLELLVDHLEAVERGEIKRLMIFKPPRHGGSLTSVRLFPSWYLGRNPGRSVIVATPELYVPGRATTEAEWQDFIELSPPVMISCTPLAVPH